jgi:hypothetical protein
VGSDTCSSFAWSPPEFAQCDRLSPREIDLTEAFSMSTFVLHRDRCGHSRQPQTRALGRASRRTSRSEGCFTRETESPRALEQHPVRPHVA